MDRKSTAPEIFAAEEDEETVEVPGATAHSPLQLPPRAWWAVIKRIYVMNGFHNLPLLAAGVAFFAFLAFVPLIAAVVLSYGLLGDPADVSRHMETVILLVPADIATLIRDQLLAIVTTSGRVAGLGLLAALLISVYGAMRASTAMIQALNVIYEEHESRNIFRVMQVSATITLGMILLAIVGIVAASLFTYIEFVLTGYLGSAVVALAQGLTWLIAGTIVSVAFGIIYRFAPDRRRAKWRWLSLGSLVAMLLWVAATLGFSVYVAYVSNYNATYGSLSTVVVFLMWLFLSSYAVLIGAEINAETERQTIQDSTVGPDRRIGERGAVMADTIALDEATKTVLEKQHRRRAERASRRASRIARKLAEQDKI